MKWSRINNGDVGFVKTALAGASTALVLVVVLPVAVGAFARPSTQPPDDLPERHREAPAHGFDTAVPVAERPTPRPVAVARQPADYAAATLERFVASERVTRVVTAEVEGRGTRNRRAAGAVELATVVHLALDGAEVLAEGAVEGARRKLEVRWVDGAPLPELGDRVALALGEDAQRQPYVLAALTEDTDAGVYRWLGGPWNPAWGATVELTAVEALARP